MIESVVEDEMKSSVRKKKLKNQDSHIHEYVISKTSASLKFCDYMYEIKTRQLDRKWNIFKKYQEKVNEKYSDKWFEENKENEKGICKRGNRWIVRLYKNKVLIYSKNHSDKESAIIDCLNARKLYSC